MEVRAMIVYGLFEYDDQYGKRTLIGLHETEDGAQRAKKTLSLKTRPNGFGGTQPYYDCLQIEEWKAARP